MLDRITVKVEALRPKSWLWLLNLGVKFQLALSIPYYKWILDTFQYPPYQGWGWNHTAILGPYSLLWWAVYKLLSLGGWTWFITGLILTDSALFALAIKYVRGNMPLLTLFVFLSSIYFYYDPADLLIVWIGLFGFYKWGFSVLALLSKLPIGSFDPGVWRFVLHSALSNLSTTPFIGLPSWSRYAILVGWCLVPLIVLPIRNLLNHKISIDVQRLKSIS